MSSFDPLKLRPNDPLEQYRDEAERQEAARERERRREEREQQRAAEAAAANEAYVLRQQFEGRVAALEGENRELRENIIDLARATMDAFETITDICEKLDQRDEVSKLKAAVAKKLREREAEFRFAREKDAEMVDSPNPLPPRRDLN
jgi:hypothetical protein